MSEIISTTTGPILPTATVSAVEEELFTMKMAAALVGTTRSELWSRFRLGEIQSTLVNRRWHRFTLRDIVAFVDKRRAAGEKLGTVILDQLAAGLSK
jgi:hypothetical protein